MKRVQYNKLIRDNVKGKIEKAGDACSVRVIKDDEELRKALLNKIKEEAEELSLAKDRNELLSEYSDLMVALDALTPLYEITEADVKVALEDNLKEKGGFKERHFLEWSEHKD